LSVSSLCKSVAKKGAVMRRLIIILLVLIITGSSIRLNGGDTFDPAKDGWYFVNKGKEGLTWDLFRKAYLAIHPTKDCVSAPLDCAFYEIFKISGKKGVCGGMSLLGLALYKYGGYMGYCSPAKFYTGGSKGPDRKDLYDALSILQARQFSVPGIRNFLDVVDAGNLNDAEAAFKTVKESLGKSDYPVLSIANSLTGKEAHTVIPYKVEENPSGYAPGTKIMYIWDPNFPYDDHANDYGGKSYNKKNIMVITGTTAWKYRKYDGANKGWCFCIPMSKVLMKSRHPLALDMVFTALMTAFVKGTGSAVTQVSDDEGHRLYKEGQPGVLETDPSKRLKGAGRWPWFEQRGQGDLPQLYFIRRPVGETTPLNISVSGREYKALFSMAGNMIEINSQSTALATDVITLTAIATAGQSIRVETSGAQRKVTVMQLRTGASEGEWRRYDVRNLRVTREAPVTIDVQGDLGAIAVSSRDRAVTFDLGIQQRVHGSVSTRTVPQLVTQPGKVLRVAPKDWKRLETTELEKKIKKRKNGHK